jgi:hypothetical protein
MNILHDNWYSFFFVLIKLVVKYGAMGHVFLYVFLVSPGQ